MGLKEGDALADDLTEDDGAGLTDVLSVDGRGFADEELGFGADELGAADELDFGESTGALPEAEGADGEEPESEPELAFGFPSQSALINLSVPSG